MNARQLLRQIYQSWYGELELGTPKSWINLEELGQELANLIGKDNPWSKRQLYSVLKYEDYNVSKKLVTALQTFAAIHFDGANPLIGRLEKKVVYSANGNLVAGSIVLGHSKRCLSCNTPFVGIVHNQVYCTQKCRKEYRRAKSKTNKNN